MATTKKKGGSLLGGLFGSGSKKPKKERELTEEELRDKALVEEFYDKGLDLKELDKYEKDKVSADQAMYESENQQSLRGPAFVINLKPFYNSIGTRTGRLAEGLVDLCIKVLSAKIGKNGRFIQPNKDVFLFQFNDGMNPQNWRTAFEAINEIGLTFLGTNYQAKDIVDGAFGQGMGEDLSGDGLEDALQAALDNVKLDPQGRLQVVGGTSGGGNGKAVPQSKPKMKGDWREKDWEEIHAALGPRAAKLIKLGEDGQPADPNWRDILFKGLVKAKGNGEWKKVDAEEFRPREKWVPRHDSRRTQDKPIPIPDRRRKKEGRRTDDSSTAVVWK